MEYSKLWAAAREWNSLGYSIYPLAANTKKPAHGTHGYLSPMTTLEEIDAHWSKNPNDNIACNPEANGFCEIDLDPGSPDSAALNLTPTYTVKTPRGGCHLRYIGSLPTTQNILAPHVDTIGLKGGIVLPPSIVGGVEYEVIDDREPEPLPSGIAERIVQSDVGRVSGDVDLDQPHSISQARTVLASRISRGGVAIAGSGGNATTYQVASDLFDLGLSLDTVNQLMRDDFNPHCQPPWASGELKQIVQNAFDYRQNDIGSDVFTPEDFSDYKNPQADKARAPSSLRILTLTDIRNKPDPIPLVRGLFTVGENICVSGQPKQGKSTIMLDAALSIASGERVFNKLDVLRSGPVVYLSGEGHGGMKARTQAWLQHRNIDEHKVPFYYVEGVPLTSKAVEQCELFIKGIQEFLQKMEHLPDPVLVVVDTMSRSLIGLDEDAENVSVYMTLTDILRRRLNTTIATVAHTGKDPARGIRGSGVSTANFDAIWSTEMNDQKVIKFESLLLRDSADLGPYCFRLKPIQVRCISTELNTGAILDNVPLSEFTEKDDGSSLVYDADLVIRPALVRMNAFGEQRAVKTLMLAEELCSIAKGESTEDWKYRVDKCRKLLNKLSKGPLCGFTFKREHEIHWMLQTK